MHSSDLDSVIYTLLITEEAEADLALCCTVPRAVTCKTYLLWTTCDSNAVLAMFHVQL